MSLSYEQKYLKYKQKYNSLKKNMNNIHLLETETGTVNMSFDLTDTPSQFSNMKGGGDTFDLTDTPMNGGAVTTTAVPPCTGIVNPMPNVTVPMKSQEGGNTEEEIVTTTDLSNIHDSDITNTEDIQKLFKQLGGKARQNSDEETTARKSSARKTSARKTRARKGSRRSSLSSSSSSSSSDSENSTTEESSDSLFEL